MLDEERVEIETFETIYGHEPGSSEEDIVSMLVGRYEDQQRDMEARFNQWAYNIRFTDGEQWLVQTDEGLGWFEPPHPDDEIRVTVNLTHGAIEYRIAKLTESRPQPKVLPHSNEIRDRDRTEAAQQLSSHLHRLLNLSERYEELLWYDSMCGCAFAYIGWASESGRFVAEKVSTVEVDEFGESRVVDRFVGVNGEIVDDEDLARLFLSGEVTFQVLPPWSVLVSDPEEVDFSKQRWVMIVTWEDEADFRAAFGAVADDVRGEEVVSTPMTHYQDLVSALSRGSAYANRRRLPTIRKPQSRVRLIRYFERPSDDFPTGRHFIVAGNKLVYEGGLPFGSPRFPLEQLRTRMRVRDFYGKPYVEDLIGPQRRINQLETHAVHYISLYASGGLMSQFGGLVEDSWLEGFGRVLYYEGDRPQPIAWPNMPSDVWNALNRAYDAFDRISGYSDVARGSVPPGVKAARAILELKRSNDTPLGRALQRFDRFVETTTHMMIQRARWGYAVPHVIEVLGHDVPHLTRSLMDDDLPTEFSVRVETDSMLRLSYPAKLEMLFELADRQWIDPASAKRMLNFGDWEHESGQWNRDYSRAREKIRTLENGGEVGVFWWEDDVVYMGAIEERLKDPSYENSPESFKMAMNKLWLAHFQQFRMKQAGELPPEMQAAMAPGRPDGRPPAGPDPMSAMPPPSPLPGGSPGVDFPSMDLTPEHDAWRPMGDMSATVVGQGF